MSRNLAQEYTHGSWTHLKEMPLQNVLYKCRFTILHVDLGSPPPPFFFTSPVPRWLTEDRLLRGRELPHVYCFNVRFAFSHRGFGVRMLSWDLCLKGSFYWGQPSRGGSWGILWKCASMIFSVNRGWKQVFLKVWFITVKARDLLEPLFVSFQKNISKVLLSVGLPVF